jgi:hypothetical protein
MYTLMEIHPRTFFKFKFSPADFELLKQTVMEIVMM